MPFVPALAYQDNLKVWLKADALNNTNGDAIGTWSDSSPQGNNFTQGTAGNKPTYVTNVINGLPILRFTRAAASNMTSTFDQDDTTGSTCFVVAKISGVNNQNCFWAESYGAADPIIDLAIETVGTLRTWTNTSTNFSDVANTLVNASQNFFIYTITINETTTVNGVTNVRQSNLNRLTVNDQGTTASRPRGNATNACIGRSSQEFEGDIAEILWYAEAMNGKNRDTVESYLQRKYFIRSPFTGFSDITQTMLFPSDPFSLVGAFKPATASTTSMLLLFS